jgi:hypothetical protein
MASCVQSELYNSVVVQLYPIIIFSSDFHKLFVDVNRFKIRRVVTETHGRIIAPTKKNCRWREVAVIMKRIYEIRVARFIKTPILLNKLHL